MHITSCVDLIAYNIIFILVPLSGMEIKLSIKIKINEQD